MSTSIFCVMFMLNARALAFSSMPGCIGAGMLCETVPGGWTVAHCCGSKSECLRTGWHTELVKESKRHKRLKGTV
jgi:hypothetical protein